MAAFCLVTPSSRCGRRSHGRYPAWLLSRALPFSWLDMPPLIVSANGYTSDSKRLPPSASIGAASVLIFMAKLVANTRGAPTQISPRMNLAVYSEDKLPKTMIEAFELASERTAQTSHMPNSPLASTRPARGSMRELPGKWVWAVTLPLQGPPTQQELSETSDQSRR